jgi:hypothetical protein
MEAFIAPTKAPEAEESHPLRHSLKHSQHPTPTTPKTDYFSSHDIRTIEPQTSNPWHQYNGKAFALCHFMASISKLANIL